MSMNLHLSWSMSSPMSQTHITSKEMLVHLHWITCEFTYWDTWKATLFIVPTAFYFPPPFLSFLKPVGEKTWAFASGRYTCPSQDLGIIMQSGDSLNWIRPYRQIIKRKPSVNSGVICKKQGHFKCVSTSISTAAAKLWLVFCLVDYLQPQPVLLKQKDKYW